MTKRSSPGQREMAFPEHKNEAHADRARVSPPTGEIVKIHTDGGCDPNPGTGGWAAVLEYKQHRREISGGEPNTTNNRMELTAAIQALASLKRPCRVVLYTDSEYVKNGITAWLPAWKRRNWSRKGGALKNVDLWQELDRLTQKHEVEWRWLKGHAGHALNERCDALANKEIAKLART